MKIFLALHFYTTYLFAIHKIFYCKNAQSHKFTKILTLKIFRLFRGIIFSRNGIWVITDYSTSFVCIYDSKDELVKMIGSPGMKNDQLCLFGITFDDNNDLYVVDGHNSRIQKFDLQGNYVFQLAEKLRNALDIIIQSISH